MKHPFASALAVCALALLTLDTARTAPQTSAPATPPASDVAAKKKAAVCNALGPKGNWEDSAKFVSGLSDRAALKDLPPDQRTAWTSYARGAKSDWTRLSREYLDRIGVWRLKTLGTKGGSGVTLYPFSGPDAAHAISMFPDSQEYVLFGLEPVGCIPAVTEEYTPEYFADLRRSLQSTVALGFFKTDDMRADLNSSEVSGVLPVLLLELAQGGFTVTDVSGIGITPEGGVVSASAAGRKETRGVAIQFRDQRHGMRTLRYFSVNVQNGPLERKPGTLKYFQNLPVNGTLVKSASYLMHKKAFSTIRGVILAKSALVVEDDSGVPYSFFDDSTWDVRLYGTYTKPIPLFKNSYQEDLFSAYQTRKDIEPLDFGFGYKFRRNESNVLVASRRGK